MKQEEEVKVERGERGGGGKRTGESRRPPGRYGSGTGFCPNPSYPCGRAARRARRAPS